MHVPTNVFLNFVNINHFSNVESERKKSYDHARQFVHLIKKEKKRRREGKKKKGRLVLSSFWMARIINLDVN